MTALSFTRCYATPFGAINMRYQENSEEFSQIADATSDNANIKLNKVIHL